MNVQVFCIKCDRSCRVPPDYVGKRVRCPGCQEIFKAEQPPLADATSDGAVEIYCRKCDRAGRVTPELLGRRVRCAGCQEAFKAEQPPLADSIADNAVQVFCPKCDQSGRVLPEWLGRRVRCSGCQGTFQAEDVPVAALDEDGNVALPPAAPTATDDRREVPAPLPLPRATPTRPKPVVEDLDDDQRTLESRYDNDEEERRAPRRHDEDDRRTVAEDRPSSSRRDVRDDDDSDRRRSARDEDSDRRRSTRDEDSDRKRSPRIEDARDRKRSSRDDDSRDRKRSDQNGEKGKGKKEPPAGVGQVQNPFIDSDTLAAAEVDHSAFEFDFGDPPERDKDKSSDKKKSSDSKSKHDRDRDRSKEKRGDEKPASRPKKDAPDTDYAWDAKKGPPSQIPAEPAPAKPASKAPVAAGASNPFAFDAGKAATPDKSDKKPCFHLRQTGFWDEPRLYRVFIEKDELIFIAAALGKDIPDMEEAIQAQSLKDFDKRIRNKVQDLNDLSIDQLLESDDASFVWSSGKILEIAIEPPGKSSNGPQSAVLQLEHKSKGLIAFDFPSDVDVEDGREILRDIFADLLQVHVRWDKASKRYVKR